MARFCPLFSGSSGNACYIGQPGSGILVDAGVSCKMLTQAMREKDIDIRGLQGIFITHEHVDHIKGLKVFLKHNDVPLFASLKTLEYLIANDHVPPGITMHPMDDGPVELEGFRVSGFHTPHDAVDSMGYRVETADDRVIGVATDLGAVTDEVAMGIEGCDLVLLEANYDVELLRTSSYPWFLKKRISSGDGHLSNDVCGRTAQWLVEKGTTRLVLGHLSKENNRPQLAYQTIWNMLQMQGCVEDVDYQLSVAPRSQPGEMILL